MMIRVCNLGFSYANTRILHDINFEVAAGTTISIMGANGSGKSTLLRLLRGRLQPESGCVYWGDIHAHNMSRREMALRVAVVSQQMQQAFGFQVRELVAMGRYIYQRALAAPSREDWDSVDRALVSTDSAHLAERCSAQLSGGELQRVMLARALAQESAVMMLDEATSQLDMGHKRSICMLLHRLCRAGKTIVQVSHDMNSAAELSDAVVLLDPAGTQIAFGPPEEVLTVENIARAYSVKVDIERHPSGGQLRFIPRPLTEV